MKQKDYDEILSIFKSEYTEDKRLKLKELESKSGLHFTNSKTDNVNNFWNYIFQKEIMGNDFLKMKYNNLTDVDARKDFFRDYMNRNYYNELQFLKELSLSSFNQIVSMMNNPELNLNVDEYDLRYILDKDLEPFILNAIFERDELEKYNNQIVKGKKLTK